MICRAERDHGLESWKRALILVKLLWIWGGHTVLSIFTSLWIKMTHIHSGAFHYLQTKIPNDELSSYLYSVPQGYPSAKSLSSMSNWFCPYLGIDFAFSARILLCDTERCACMLPKCTPKKLRPKGREESRPLTTKIMLWCFLVSVWSIGDQASFQPETNFPLLQQIPSLLAPFTATITLCTTSFTGYSELEGTLKDLQVHSVWMAQMRVEPTRHNRDMISTMLCPAKLISGSSG